MSRPSGMITTTAPLASRTGRSEKSKMTTSPDGRRSSHSVRMVSPAAARAMASRSCSGAPGVWVHHTVSQNGRPTTSSRADGPNASAAWLTSSSVPSGDRKPMYSSVPS